MTARLLADAILLSMLIIATPAAAPDDDWTKFAAPTDRVASYSPTPMPHDMAAPPVENVRDGTVVERALTVTPLPVAGRTAPLTDLLGCYLGTRSPLVTSLGSAAGS